MAQIALKYAIALVLTIVIDGCWIAVVALPMFRATLGQEMLVARLIPGIIFYILYAAGILTFVLPLGAGSLATTALYGAAFGLVTYATYDLTNLATLKAWTVSLALADILWGLVMTAAVSTLVVIATSALSSRFTN
jgi:uncharacterized membrane protein